MKVLMITPYLPYPLYSGGQIRSYNLLKNLAKSHEITLFAFVKEVIPDHIRALEKFCKKIEVFKRRKAWSVVNILVSGFSFYPFLVAKHSPKPSADTFGRTNYRISGLCTFFGDFEP